MTNINPIPTNIRPINPPPGGLFLPGPFGEEEVSGEGEDLNDGYLETEDVDVELDLSPDDNLPDEEVDRELEELVEIESIPGSEQLEESTGNPSKITGFAAADLVGNGGFGIGVIVLLVAGLIALRIRMKKKRFIVP